jgi:hypothetical protein
MAAEIKLFGKWSYKELNIGDITLEDFIAIKEKDHVFIPHTAGRYQIKRFRKAQCPAVERLANALMRKGRNNGKKVLAMRIIQQVRAPQQQAVAGDWQPATRGAATGGRGHPARAQAAGSVLSSVTPSAHAAASRRLPRRF